MFVDVTILDDLRNESREYFYLLITPASGVFPTHGFANHRVAISGEDAPLVFRLKAASSRAGEGYAFAPVYIERVGGEQDPWEVLYEVLPGTAERNWDYAGSTGTITFTPGGLDQGILIPLVDDEIVERDETFTVRLWFNGLPSYEQHTVTIVDDDRAHADVRGTYVGVGDLAPGWSFAANVVRSSAGSVSASIKVNGRVFRFGGTFSRDGFFQQTRRDEDGLSLTLTLRDAFDGALIEGEFQGQPFVAQRAEIRLGSGILPKAGRYNSVIESGPDLRGFMTDLGFAVRAGDWERVFNGAGPICVRLEDRPQWRGSILSLRRRVQL